MNRIPKSTTTGMGSQLRKDQRVFVSTLGIILALGFIFIIQHWNEFQTSIPLTGDDSALSRFLFGHYLSLAVLRSALVLLTIIILFSLCIILLKLYWAVEIRTNIFQMRTTSREIEEIKNSYDDIIEEYRKKIEELNLKLLIKDVLSKPQEREGRKHGQSRVS